MNEIQKRLESNEIDDLCDVITDIGKSCMYEYEDEIWNFLKHTNPEIRNAAIQTISIYWEREKFLSLADEIWNNDPDEEVRIAALGGWFIFYQKTSNKEVLNILDHILKNNKNLSLRIEAHRGIYVVAGLNEPSLQNKMFFELDDFLSEVNWLEINEIIPSPPSI